MFDTIILLSDAIERTTLPQVLRRHNPLLTVVSVGSRCELEALDPNSLARARLIGFVTPVIVPEAVLAQLGYGAINFHPGSPSYPGWAPAHFALYNREAEFGVTVHVMAAQVDSGPIIDVTLFPVPAQISVLELEALAYQHLAGSFWRMARSLATDPRLPQPKPFQWSDRKYSRNSYRAMCDIPLDIPREEFERRIKVFGQSHFGISPTIHLHGVEFRAVSSSARSAQAGADPRVAVQR
jgi:methionyl-tRNA formyltransferase